MSRVASRIIGFPSQIIFEARAKKKFKRKKKVLKIWRQLNWHLYANITKFFSSTASPMNSSEWLHFIFRTYNNMEKRLIHVHLHIKRHFPGRLSATGQNILWINAKPLTSNVVFFLTSYQSFCDRTLLWLLQILDIVITVKELEKRPSKYLRVANLTSPIFIYLDQFIMPTEKEIGH